jgi:hypothetical protein
MQSTLDQADADLAAKQRQDDAARTERTMITEDKADWVIAHLTARECLFCAAETRQFQWLGDETVKVPRQAAGGHRDRQPRPPPRPLIA